MRDSEHHSIELLSAESTLGPQPDQVASETVRARDAAPVTVDQHIMSHSELNIISTLTLGSVPYTLV